MSGATATRQARSKKGVTKGKRKKAASAPASPPPPPAAKSPATKVAAPKGKGAPAPAAPGLRKKLKVRSGPPPVDLEIDPDVLEFIKAIDDYRAKHDRPFPTWSEVLHVFKGLGYKKAR